MAEQKVIRETKWISNLDWKEPEEDFKKGSARIRLEQIEITNKLSERIVDQAFKANNRWHLAQLLFSILLFIGGAVSIGYSIYTFTISRELLTVDTLLSPQILLAFFGLVLVGISVSIGRYPATQRGLEGISQIQQELASGFGETRPLVQVVQETINNARQTFIVQLRLSQSLFWVGILFIGVAFYRILIFGETDWLTITLTGGTGILSWIFSFFISQRKEIQANLANVTQLELGLVGLAKQVTAIDKWLMNFVFDQALVQDMKLEYSAKILDWSINKIQKGTLSAAALVELFTQIAEGTEEEKREYRKMIADEAKKHMDISSDSDLSSS